jgi:hypothetical protein
MDTRQSSVRLAVFMVSVHLNAGCAGSEPAEASCTSAVGVSPELEIDPPDLGPAAREQPGASLVRAGDHYLACGSTTAPPSA